MEKLENWKQRPLSQVVSRWIRGTTLNRSKTDYYTKNSPAGKPSMGKSWGHKRRIYFPDRKLSYQRRGRPDPVAGSAKGRCAALRIRNDWKSGYCRL